MTNRTSAEGAKPASAIFIGNSFFYYNNGVNTHLAQLIAAASPARPWCSTLVGISGAGLDWHDVESYFRPGAIGSFSFDANNDIVFNKLARLFDVAVLMDGSQSPIHPALAQASRDYFRQHCATLRRHGAEPVLFMTWAYADRPDMTAPLAQAYRRAGADNDARVIPAGLAFAHAASVRPDMDLWHADKRHPSLAGTYLSACLTYAVLFETSPLGLAYDAGLGAQTATFLQQVAQDSLSGYQR